VRSFTLKERFRYWFDNYMARGTGALIAGLAVISLVLILIIAGVITLTGTGPGDGGQISFFEAFWLSLMRTLDAGTMGGDEGTRFRLIMFIVTIGGIFIISTLIGTLTSGIEGKLEDLRKGRSRVVEKGHTIILGWSSQVFSIVSELIIANENQAHACIVIMGDKDKVEMEDEIHTNVEHPSGHTRIVCRTGSPIDMNDLELINLQTSKSIIILSPDAENPDASTIKTMLAITNSPQRRKDPYHIVAEIRDPKNLEVARLVGKDEVELVLTGNLVSRIIAQTCRQSGLSVIFTELLDFDGDEIYFKEEPSLQGKTFGEALMVYDDSAVIGVCSHEGSTQLNPPMDTLLQPGDQIIAVSADDDTIRLSGLGSASIKESAIKTHLHRTYAPERTLILGWNWRAPSIIHELDQYVSPGSFIQVIADVESSAEEILRTYPDIKNQSITFQKGDTTDRRLLDNLNIPSFQHVILLCYSDLLSLQEADARTLITLLHLRDISSHCENHFSIVSEMLDVRNRALAAVTQADDFIVSDKLISLMLSQISENKKLNAVFADIFDADGSEIYLKPAGDYVALGEPSNFYTVVESARRRGEVAFGYRLKALSSSQEHAYGVVVNPQKSKPVTFVEEDRIAVLAEN
jgi:ion channel POLLUX/CASTOR